MSIHPSPVLLERREIPFALPPILFSIFLSFEFINAWSFLLPRYHYYLFIFGLVFVSARQG